MVTKRVRVALDHHQKKGTQEKKNIMPNMLSFQQQQKQIEQSDEDCEELLHPVVFSFSHKKKDLVMKK